jgi:hypothetical protein
LASRYLGEEHAKVLMKASGFMAFHSPSIMAMHDMAWNMPDVGKDMPPVGVGTSPAKLESAVRGRYGDEATAGLTNVFLALPDKFRGPLAAVFGGSCGIYPSSPAPMTPAARASRSSAGSRGTPNPPAIPANASGIAAAHDTRQSHRHTA